jgi:hypothetical protein
MEGEISLRKTCPECKQALRMDRLKLPKLVASSRWRYCDTCGYPLNTADLLERISAQRNKILEVIRTQDYKSSLPYACLEVDSALEILDLNKGLIFPEYEDEGLVVLSIVGDILIFNFGQPGTFRGYLRVFLGEEDKETSVGGRKGKYIE